VHRLDAKLKAMKAELKAAVQATGSRYLSHFRKPHRQTADSAKSWKNLRHFLQPAERWPALYEPGASRARSVPP